MCRWSPWAPSSSGSVGARGCVIMIMIITTTIITTIMIRLLITISSSSSRRSSSSSSSSSYPFFESDAFLLLFGWWSGISRIRFLYIYIYIHTYIVCTYGAFDSPTKLPGSSQSGLQHGAYVQGFQGYGLSILWIRYLAPRMCVCCC